MKNYNFDNHPDIQYYMRHLASFGTLDERQITLLLESLSDVLGELNKLRLWQESCECGATT